jgi:hypothetical protein
VEDVAMGKELKRMRYFDGLFLNAEDYKLDQEYQMRLQQLHNRYLHTWGIVYGLEVTPLMPLKYDNSEETSTVSNENNEEVSEKYRCTLVISKGLAQNQVINKETGESISQMIYIGEESTIDLSKYYNGNEEIYIYVNYQEEKCGRDYENGKGQEIYIKECGNIGHTLKSSYNKELNEKELIVLARVKLGLDNGKKCIKDISYIDADSKMSLRTYAGPAGSVLALEKIIFKLGEEIADMPYIKVSDFENKITGLEVNSLETMFTGSVDVKGDLTVKGNLNSENNDPSKEFSVSNCFVQVNSKSETGEWEKQDGGLQVYRGESESYPDACLIWSEENQRWRVGFIHKEAGEEKYDKFFDIAYGDPWEKLIGNVIVDDLHRHNKLFYPIKASTGQTINYGVALEAADDSGNLTFNGDININDRTLWLRSKDNISNGLGWFGTGKKFAGLEVDGPVLFGLKGGILGTTDKAEKAVLTWNSLGNVGVGVENAIDDKLEVAGSLRILSSSNPVRFTSEYKGFANNNINYAEISNDTVSKKALTIVGNKSADGKTSKVAIWDRLDVNGILSVNGSMKLSQALNPSTGSGANNGIVFPSDPGGGLYDAAWLKYYARSGEACNLEIGVSNDADDHIALMASGNVGIGTVNPADKLDVNGYMRIMSGSNPIRFTSQWSGFPDKAGNQAEICNDTSSFKSLMIVGNQSAGQGRKVAIWDRLDVNGQLIVKGDLKTQCAIVPSVGNDSNSGITFPKDYYGGSGDSAWIRYFSDPERVNAPGGRENTTLEIGISNDPGTGGLYGGGDRIRLHASGGVYVDGYFYYVSSRDLKENIEKLSTQKAKNILDGLNPVEFNFIGDTEKTTLGFIAEEVPCEVSAKDKKAISPMEIITVLASVVKDQRKNILELQKQVEELL